MARLQRVTSKVFAENATEVGQFGSLNAGTKVTTTDIATIQGLPAWQNGWQAATVGENCYPTLQERNGLDKVQSYFLNYLLQEGIPEWDSGTTYYTGSIVKLINGVDVQFYKSLKDNNTAVLSDTDYWEKVQLGGGASRNIGEIVTSTIPLTDAGLHLLDGTLLPYGVYKEFIDYIADLYAENPSANYFTTEAQWQQSVTTYGVCGKFVYDSVNNTVRLPKITGIIEGTTDLTALGDLVEAGLPNITGTAYGDEFPGTILSTGAFYDAGEDKDTAVGNTNKSHILGFDASRVSSLYKNNFNKVQPQTIKAFYYIVIATSTKTDIQVDIDNIATDLNGKADVDLTNVNQAGKNNIMAWGIPDWTKGVKKSVNTLYVAKNNCYVTVFGVATASNFVQLYVEDENGNPAIAIGVWPGVIWSIQNTRGAHDSGGAFIPKGYKYKGQGATESIVEYPLKGAN